MHGLRIENVTKTFKDKKAVDGVSICFGNGIYGLLGENGAGKTTLMRIVCGLLQPTSGTVCCDGMDIRRMGSRYRSLLGYLPQDLGYYPDHSARRFLLYMAALKALPEKRAKERIEELLELVGLSDVKDKKLKTFSGGMLRRVGIAQALLNEPRILVMDEPTSGLDPKERVRFRNIISALGKDRTVLFSTHIVSDVEYIADQILMMQHGRLTASGNVEEILSAVAGRVWECTVAPEEAVRLDAAYLTSNIRNVADGVLIRLIADQEPTTDARPAAPTLEDAYLYHLELDRDGKRRIRI